MVPLHNVTARDCVSGRQRQPKTGTNGGLFSAIYQCGDSTAPRSRKKYRNNASRTTVRSPRRHRTAALACSCAGAVSGARLQDITNWTQPVSSRSLTTHHRSPCRRIRLHTPSTDARKSFNDLPIGQLCFLSKNWGSEGDSSTQQFTSRDH
jgi:hypothetical protein